MRVKVQLHVRSHGYVAAADAVAVRQAYEAFRERLQALGIDLGPGGLVVGEEEEA